MLLKSSKTMERCSYFIPDKALFGSFPTQEAVSELEVNGVRYFVDLTTANERKTTPYITNYHYIKYPITDHNIPYDKLSFAQLILKISQIIKNLNDGEKIYVHCKGGHGRAGIVVACVLCFVKGIRPTEALDETTTYHSRRSEMKERWRKIGSPQTRDQKEFVRRFFKAIRYTRNNTNIYTSGFNNFSPYPVVIPGLGVFPSAYMAFQAYRDPKNVEYVTKLIKGKFEPDLIKTHASHWEENKVQYMETVLIYKFKCNEILKANLLNTGLKKLVNHGSKDSFWGIGGNGQGKNVHGKLLCKIRNQLLLEDLEKKYN